VGVCNGRRQALGRVDLSQFPILIHIDFGTARRRCRVLGRPDRRLEVPLAALEGG